jgi:transcriptional regulator of arginine metabolism
LNKYAHRLVKTMPTDIEQRDRRRHAIVDLVRRSRIASQEELREKLAARGFVATQPSVSRDLRDLGVGKAGGRYVLADELGPETRDALAEVVHFVRDIRTAGPHLAVISTTVGAAQTVAIALDHAGFPELVGTVAGDDTIFVATASAALQRRFVERLRLSLSAPTPLPMPAPGTAPARARRRTA